MEQGCLATQGAEGVQRVHMLLEDEGKTQDAILGEKNTAYMCIHRVAVAGTGKKKNVLNATKN